ncbi:MULTISPECIES: ABC transporter ATP-binding protein [Acetobacter]|uniref:Lipoprotein-releasing system ATP-binding protein LolD n=1 Tax=Acetobacter pomorum DM001 TaxID=945681 RepID=F1YTZ3_9PROT|nr:MULTISPECIES: ABC transporter ATP-binding protein [Acetobacter]ATI13119.1 ABC transporter ATP-binding protein [Acetobacter pomorum]AXC26766.1 ABC transporter ATP-binding protein [Acetobacter sp. JWB]EGE47858.1 Lipoprotein-releasing system ATP-binding protein LolD [Acetobacter pomorum DM001]KAA8429252.1 ABC transporter ATP-binding protein [Acetobacter pomorum]KAA8436234.1 ABC transporter ATP-binding protein [Acetobacter pomorum]
MNNQPVLSLQHVRKAYQSGDEGILPVLQDINFSLHAGEIVGLVAPSGTGKSTLLHLAGLLDTPDAGEIVIAGQITTGMADAGRTAMRRDRIGFVYQFHHLLGEFTAKENVVLPQMIAGVSKVQARRKAEELLSMFGLAHRVNHLPGKLSGGEQQRVAIARALANDPALLLADEPTGNLDVHTADSVFSQLLDVVRQKGLAVLVATHNRELLPRMDRVVTMQEGRLIPADFNGDPLPASAG